MGLSNLLRKRSVAHLLPLLALLACKKSVPELVQEHRAGVTQTFEKLRALRSVVDATPPTTQDGVHLDGQQVVLDGENENALFVPANDLATPDRIDSERIGAVFAIPAEHCGELMRGKFSGAASVAQTSLRTCTDAKFVFVLRTASYESGTTTGQDTYRPGEFTGDVLLFRLADRKLLGGFSVSAKNSSALTVTSRDTEISKLEDDLSSNLFVAIKKGLQRHVPGSVGP